MAQAVTVATLNEQLGEALHTAFRKAAFSGDAARTHSLIRALPGDEWQSIITFVIDSMPTIETSDVEWRAALPFTEALRTVLPFAESRVEDLEAYVAKNPFAAHRDAIPSEGLLSSVEYARNARGAVDAAKALLGET